MRRLIRYIAYFFATPALLGASIFTTATTHAVDSQVSVTCTITAKDFDAVNAAANEGLLAELAARRALLSRTIICARNDAKALQEDLNGLSIPDDAKNLQVQLSGKLDDAMTYYDLELDKVGNAGIAGTQAIAREVLGWRASTYEPLAGQVENFTLWAKNQTLFKAANDRLQGITSLVAFLQQAGQNNDLQGDLSTAQAMMQTAKEENQAAKSALLQYVPPDESLQLIQRSLKSLSDTYQKFFDIAKIVQALLPTEK